MIKNRLIKKLKKTKIKIAKNRNLNKLRIIVKMVTKMIRKQIIKRNRLIKKM